VYADRLSLNPSVNITRQKIGSMSLSFGILSLFCPCGKLFLYLQICTSSGSNCQNNASSWKMRKVNILLSVLQSPPSTPIDSQVVT